MLFWPLWYKFIYRIKLLEMIILGQQIAVKLTPIESSGRLDQLLVVDG